MWKRADYKLAGTLALVPVSCYVGIVPWPTACEGVVARHNAQGGLASSHQGARALAQASIPKHTVLSGLFQGIPVLIGLT